MYKHKIIFSYVLLFIFCFCILLSNVKQKKQEEDYSLMYEKYDKEIENLKNEIEIIKNENDSILKDLEEVRNNMKESKVTVQEEIELSDEEIKLFEKFIAYFCKNEPDSTKIYVGYVLINRMYEQNLPFYETIDSFGISRNNLEVVEITNEDSVVNKVLHLTYKEIQERSSGAIYFYEENVIYEKEWGSELETFLTLFKSGKYIFFTDLANG